MRFVNFFSGGFTIMAVINPPESKLAKRTSVHCRFEISTHCRVEISRNNAWKFQNKQTQKQTKQTIITDTLKPWNLAYHAVWLLSFFLATTSTANNSSFSVVVYTLYCTSCTTVDCVHATKDYKSNLELVEKKFYVVNCPSLKNG